MASPDPRPELELGDASPTVPGHLEAEPFSEGPPPVPPSAPDSYRAIFSLALPLVLSSTGFMVMQFVDALFLSWYSKEAVAAAVPASITHWLAMSLFVGLTSYTGTFVAQYTGAKRLERVGHAVWQGLYVAMGGGVLIALLVFPAPALFDWMGHEPSIRALELEYFRIVIVAAPVFLIDKPFSGFFSGRGDTRTVMCAHLAAIALNVGLDYLFIFGKWGLPEMGMAGAAWATVLAHSVSVVYLGALFFRKTNRERFGTWSQRGFDRDLFVRLLRYGFPNGLRFTVEIFAWNAFVALVGRLGPTELTASSIAWRLNGIAFFPLIGLSTATSILVGQAQGAGEPHRAVVCTRRSLLVAEAWMLMAAALFLLAPGPLFDLFHDADSAVADDFAATRALGIVLLRYVALYSLLDGFNIILAGALQGAGDTRWTMLVSLGLHAVFVAGLWAMSDAGAAIHTYWAAATGFVMFQALIWLARFASGRWKSMSIIEESLPEAVPGTMPEPS